MVYGEDPAVFRMYWRGFIENMKQSSMIGIFVAAISCLLWVDLWATARMNSDVKVLLQFIFFATVLASSFVLLYLFPLMIHTEASIKKLLFNAVIIAMYKPHYTLMNLLIVVGLSNLSAHSPFVFLFFGWSVSAYITYWFADQKFKTFFRSGVGGIINTDNA